MEDEYYDDGGGDADVERGGSDRTGRYLMYMLVAPAVCRWLTDPKRRWTRTQGLWLCGAFLVAAGAFLVQEQLTEGGGNMYTLLDTPVSSTARQIKKAYKTQSLKYHPDKLGELDPAAEAAANAQFVRIRDAYEVLTDPAKKGTYDRFGPQVLKWQEEARNDEQVSAIFTKIMFQIGVWYLQMLVMGFLHTFGEGGAKAKQWVFGGLAVLAIVEVLVKFNQWDFMTAVFSQTPPYEKVDVLRTLFPSFMSGAVIFGKLTYVDPVARYTQMLAVVQKQNTELLVAMRVLIAQTQQGRGGAADAARNAAAAINAAPTGAASPGSPGGKPANVAQRGKKRGPGAAGPDATAAAAVTAAGAAGAPAAEPKKQKTVNIGVGQILFAAFAFAWWRGYI